MQGDKRNIPLDKFIDIHKFMNIFCCCHFKKVNWYKDYENALKIVRNDISANLNIVAWNRRIRSHGFALSMLHDNATL